MKALLLIDIQNDFMPGGALPVNEGDQIVAPVNACMHDYPLIVATQDWHPVGHESFASAHAGAQPFSLINLHGLEQTFWPDHCIAGSQGAALHAALDTSRIVAIFRKGMDKQIDSYSAFYDNGHRHNTQLAAYLQAYGVTEIDVAGLAADYCVYYSIQDALAAGFRVTLLEKATRAIDAADYAEKKAKLLKHPAFTLR
ncbi:MAG: bifunctional nicotinamidase/pyrazinamidase [Cardiobacteriaceae bacterium]|nr:bifunctional nicotinamidase/pyrazinamidase [Cardiobacteriaceae bacterium]